MIAEFPGRAIIITGAAGGIGAACAKLLAARGANLLLVDRASAPLDALRLALPSSDGTGPQVTAMALDVTVEADMQRMADSALQQFGRQRPVAADRRVDQNPQIVPGVIGH